MGNPLESYGIFELLTLDDYAKRLKVGRTTIFKWKKDGTLVPGRHFIQKNKIVRYIWSLDAIIEIQERKIQKSEITDKQNMDYRMKEKIKPGNKSSINLEY